MIDWYNALFGLGLISFAVMAWKFIDGLWEWLEHKVRQLFNKGK